MLKYIIVLLTVALISSCTNLLSVPPTSNIDTTDTAVTNTTPVVVTQEQVAEDEDIFDDLFPVIGEAEAGDFVVTESGEIFKVLKGFSRKTGGIYIWKPSAYTSESILVDTNDDLYNIVKVVKPFQVKEYGELSMQFNKQDK